MFYLCSPYSHMDPAVREQRFRAVCRAAALLTSQRDEPVFSPIAHTHPIALAGKLPTGWDYWKSVDEQFLRVCTRVIVLRLPGWDVSRGVRAELDMATMRGIPVEYVDLAELEAENMRQFSEFIKPKEKSGG